MALTCCSLHNLCESHGEDDDSVWEAHAVAAGPNVVLSQAVEEEGRDVREGLMHYWNR